MGAPPLEASISRRDGTYVVVVADVEIGAEPDVPSATSLLCREAAKYSRRVFVTTHVSAQGRQTFEIDEDGTIAQTAPAAPATSGADAAAELMRRRGGPVPASKPSSGTPQHPTPARPGMQVHRAATGAGPADADQVLIAGGGYPGTGAVRANGRGTTTPRWWLRRHRRTLAAALALTVLVVAALLSLSVNLTAADRAETEREALEAATPVGTDQLDTLRATVATGGQEALDRAVAELRAAGYTVSTTAAPAPPHPTAVLENHGTQTTVTLTGTGNVDPLTVLTAPAPALEVVSVSPADDATSYVVLTHDYSPRR